MKYQIDITGMHCKGCVGLIQISLEELGLNSIKVDLKHEHATFVTDRSQSELVKQLEQSFSELSNYSFSNLQVID